MSASSNLNHPSVGFYDTHPAWSWTGGNFTPGMAASTTPLVPGASTQFGRTSTSSMLQSDGCSASIWYTETYTLETYCFI